MTALYWLILGLVLLFVEVATPGFVSMFFGMAALTVALITWVIPLGQIFPWLLFAILSVAYIILFRKLLKHAFMGDKSTPDRLEDSFVGKYATVTKAMTAGKPGKVEFSGCDWEAECDTEVAVNDRVKIIGKNNLTLIVAKDI
ncbi:MAG: NfeD family protein [Kiritimatiellae bacterium]|jgi:membrane protein implicated in regulation of membrane protease activity|nr:NfeD family protein [Kiritimatiellia bacterium]